MKVRLEVHALFHELTDVQRASVEELRMAIEEKLGRYAGAVWEVSLGTTNEEEFKRSRSEKAKRDKEATAPTQSGHYV